MSGWRVGRRFSSRSGTTVDLRDRGSRSSSGRRPASTSSPTARKEAPPRTGSSPSRWSSPERPTSSSGHGAERNSVLSEWRRDSASRTFRRSGKRMSTRSSLQSSCSRGLPRLPTAFRASSRRGRVLVNFAKALKAASLFRWTRPHSSKHLKTALACASRWKALPMNTARRRAACHRRAHNPNRVFRASRSAANGDAFVQFQRYTRTGVLECVSTLTVSLPRTRADMPRRPCEAITIRSHCRDLAVSMIAL